MTPEQKEELTLKFINSRRKTYGFRKTITKEDITPNNSVSYNWAKELVNVVEKFLQEKTI